MASSLTDVKIEDLTKESIFQGFWGATALTGLRNTRNYNWDAYFGRTGHYVSQCQELNHVKTATHDELITVVTKLEADPSMTHQDLSDFIENEQTLTGSYGDTEGRNDTITLAASVFLMIETSNPSRSVSGRPLLDWGSTAHSAKSLKTVLAEHIKDTSALGHDKLKFTSIFKARNFQSVAGLQIEWTSNLLEHLRVTEDAETGAVQVAIFHHAAFLQWYTGDMFPANFIQETLDTLALLFPTRDKATRIWYKGECKRRRKHQHLDNSLVKYGNLSEDKRKIEHFKFYHDRLVILKQEFDDNRPSGWRQIWKNRRDPIQWSTFWVAILVVLLTILFGLFQSVLAAVQVYKAYHPSP